jgi:signal transduction histidine kinase
VFTQHSYLHLIRTHIHTLPLLLNTQHAIGTRRVVTTVTLSEGGACLKFSVRDYGEGLTPQASSRLFQKFTQLERSDGRTHMGGLGLGLFGVSVKAQVLGTSLLC